MDEHAANARSDVYSLGCLLFHCLTGEVVFPDVNAIRKVMCHASESPRSVSDLNPDVPEAVAKVVATMLSKEPDDRYQRAEDIAEALELFIESDEDLGTAAIDADPKFLQWSGSTDDLSVKQDATAEHRSGQADLAEWMATDQHGDEP